VLGIDALPEQTFPRRFPLVEPCPVANGSWIVEAADAFGAWEARHRPSAEEKGAVAQWLELCEQQGPPPADDVDDRGNMRSAVAGIEVIFRRFDLPAGVDPLGYIVLKIG
jgi:hypothetical protein